MASDHNGHFRLYRVDDRVRPWRVDDGTDNGWNVSVHWLDVEPDIPISLGRDGRYGMAQRLCGGPCERTGVLVSLR